MAQTFKAKTLVSSTGIFSYEVVAPNLVFNTGNQDIGGNKNFYSRPTVNGTGVLLSGEAASLPTTIVYITGDQTISGVKTFDVAPIVSGNAFITGVNLSSYATVSNLFTTGSTLDNKISSLSGYLNFSNNNRVFTTGNQVISGTKTFANNLEVQGTGIFNALDLSNISEFNFSGTNINLISGNVNISGGTLYISGNAVLTGVNLNAYATTVNLFATGSNLDNKINSLSGAFTSYTGSLDTNFATDAQLFNTGSTLDNKINSLSGYVNSQDTLFSGQTFNTGSRLDNKINSLSGYVNAQDIIFSGQIASTGSSLYNSILSLSGLFTGYTGSLDAMFASDAQLFTTGLTLDNKINSLSGYINSQDILFSGQAASTGSNLNDKIDSLSGLFTTYTGNLDASFATDAQLFATGSVLDNKINSLSGYVDSKDVILSDQIASTGSNLNNKINSLSGVSVLKFGDQTISGNKTFLNNINVSGSGIFNALDLNNIDALNFSGVDISITNGSVNLTNRPTVNSSGVALIGELVNTGSLLNDKINSLSGLFTIYTGNLDANFATDAQLFSTGSNLNNKINSLSGYVNSQDILFSGQAASTGSRLDNKINSLSGYSNSQDIILSGQIASTGSNLNDKINSLNTLFTGYTGSLDTTFATDAQLFSTGSILDDKINSLSGYVNAQSTSGQVFNTGSTLDNKINALSGYVNSQDIIFSGQIASTGSSLYNSIVFLSDLFTGYTGSLDANFASDAQLFNTGSVLHDKINSLSGVSVLTFGNQTIAGKKTFTDTLAIGTISGLKSSNPNSLNLIASNDNTVFAGLNLAGNIGLTAGTGTSFGSSTYGNINLNAGGPKNEGQVNLFGNVNVNNTSAVSSRTINIYKTGMSFGSPSAIAGLTINNDSISLNTPGDGVGFGLYISGVGVTPALYAKITNLQSTGSILDDKINSLSGYVNSSDSLFSGQNASTGSILDNKINSLSGYVNSQDLVFSGRIASTGSTLNNKINNLSGVSVLTFGNQNIGGNKTFTGITTFSGQQINLIDTALNLSGVGDMTFDSTNINFINSPVFISGTNLRVSGNVYANNLVYNIQNQTISGNKNFYGDVLLSGENNRIGRYHYLSTDGDFVYIKLQDGITIFSSEEASLYSYNGFPSVRFDGRILTDGNQESINWNERYLANQNGAPVLYWTGDNIGIGTSTPTEKLEVVGNLKLPANSSKIIIYDAPNNYNGAIQWSDDELTFQAAYDDANSTTTFGCLFGAGPLGENVLYSYKAGDAFATYLNMPSGRNGYIAINEDLVATGSTLNNSINSLSGTLTSTYATITNLASTGSNLNTQIENTKKLAIAYAIAL